MFYLLSGQMKLFRLPVAYCFLRIISDPVSACKVRGWKGLNCHFQSASLEHQFCRSTFEVV